MSILYNTRIQAVVLKFEGQTPTFPDAGLNPASQGWKTTDIMPGEWAYNIADDKWFYNNGGMIKPLPLNQPGDILTPSNTALFNPAKEPDASGYAYLAGKDFVVYSNLSSPDEAFWEKDIYLCVANAEPGESPESHPAKWENKGREVTVSTAGSATVFYSNVEKIKEIISYKNGNNAIDNSNGDVYTYNKDATVGVQPNDNEDAQGRWVVIGNIGADKNKRYSVDFGIYAFSAQEINMFSAGKIVNVVGSNINTVKLSWSGGIQQTITPGINSIEVEENDILTWEIERTIDGQIATLGIILKLD